MRIDANIIARARTAVALLLDRTPLVRADSLHPDGAALYLKNETVLPTGSFKVRGALYALQAVLAQARPAEIVAASTGNHGAAVAYAGRLLGVPVRIFLPEHSNPVKAARIREFGANLVEDGRDLSDAIDAATAYVSDGRAYFLHDASSPEVPAGAATIGAEILEDLPGVDEVVVPMGDTALIRGVASALQSSDRLIRVVGVVAANAPAYQLSWQSGELTETATATTIADGLAVRRPLAPNVASIRTLAHDVVAVSEQEMMDAIARLHAATGIVAEPSGAAALAAIQCGRAGKSAITVALVTGGNISPEVARQCL